MAVVAAGELDDFVSAGGSSGEADCGHNGFGAAGDEADLFDGIDGFDDHLGEGGLQWGRYAVAGALCHGLSDLIEDCFVGVAEDHGAPRQAVIDVSVVVGVGEDGALCFFDENGVCAHGFECSDGAVDAAGYDLECLFVEPGVVFGFHAAIL